MGIGGTAVTVGGMGVAVGGTGVAVGGIGVGVLVGSTVAVGVTLAVMVAIASGSPQAETRRTVARSRGKTRKLRQHCHRSHVL